jgi:hypothetical protein
MGDFKGSFQYLSSNGNVRIEGECRVEHDDTTLSVVPDSGAAITLDFGDIDSLLAADYEVRMPLYTGSTIVLRAFGKQYPKLASELLAAFRERMLKCLLLEDMEEIERYDANFSVAKGGGHCPKCGARDRGGKFCPDCGQKLEHSILNRPFPNEGKDRAPEPVSGSGEVRLYKSNIALLGTNVPSFQWRLADVDRIIYEGGSYEVALKSGDSYLTISGLAKRTEEFAGKLKKAVSDLATQSSQALHASFPFLNPDQLVEANMLMREGRSALVAKLKQISPRIEVALASNAVDTTLRPYFDHLRKLMAEDSLYAGFKIIRAEEQETHAETPGPDDAGADASGSVEKMTHADDAGPQTLYWFFFPMATKKVVAWEASSRSGRATYFFRAGDPFEESIRTINDALDMLNFRRRPIYLSDDELEMKPEFHRYAIAARRLPELRALRASFLGRAIHTTPEAWQAQVRSILEKA